MVVVEIGIQYDLVPAAYTSDACPFVTFYE